MSHWAGEAEQILEKKTIEAYQLLPHMEESCQIMVARQCYFRIGHFQIKIIQLFRGPITYNFYSV